MVVAVTEPSAPPSKRARVVRDEDPSSVKPYPAPGDARRDGWTNPRTGRAVTPFQFRVYDLCAQIPEGRFSTYKEIADKLGSHPRAVGQALRVNPFCPLPVPCHRVVASDFFIGGFNGAWGSGETIERKRKLLADEGVQIDLSGHVRADQRTTALHPFA